MSASPRRVLVCGPVFAPNRVNGVRDVLVDLIAGLRDSGWTVDTLLSPADDPSIECTCPLPGGAKSRLAMLGRLFPIPDGVRLAFRMVVHDLGQARQAAAALSAIERRVADGRYSALLVCLQNAPLGTAALATRVHPRPILISMPALADEVRHQRLLRALRRLLAAGSGRFKHPDLHRPVDPRQITTAVFASSAWRDDAVRAGVPADAAHTVRFGVPCPSALPPRARPSVPARLLWAARLSAEKGLHVYLPALARLRSELPFQLTIVAGEANAAYSRKIARTIVSLRLEDVVRIVPAVDRAALPRLFAEHDLMLFFSVFREPVAQMMLLACAAGLPVVAPPPADGRSIVKPEITAFCFADTRPRSIADAIARALTDEVARERLRRHAFDLVRSEHSLEATIARYDALLGKSEMPTRMVRRTCGTT